MISSNRPLRSLLAVAVALAAAPALAKGGYTQTVFFGDSLTDSGHFRPVLPPSVQAVTGKFTTNPGWVWAEYVADRYGGDGASDNAGGDNYAQGGSRVTLQNGSAESTAAQVTRYLAANGGKADADALYTVWTGANDIFAIAAGAPAQSTLATAATGTVAIVGQLQSAGARYVLVPTLPDMGLTPNARAAGAAGMAQLTQLATSYNTAVFAGLASAGYRVIPVDTFHLLQEVVANPGAYGFRNVTNTACLPPSGSSLTCNPTSLVSPDAPNTYVFADGVHPTSATHQIMGQYAISLLEAPRLQQVLSHSAQVIGRARVDQVAWHLDGAPQGDGLRWWGSLRGDQQRYAHADLYDGMAPAGLFGLDWSRGSWVFGGFAGYGRLKADFGNSAGDFTQTDTTLGGFAGWYGAHAWINGQASYSWLGYDVHRQVNLGPAVRRHDGSPDGSNVAVAVNAGYEFGEGALRHGPVAGATWQKTKRDGYSEGNPGSTALAYGDQDADSVVGRVGWQARYAIGAVKPYVQATYDHEFKDAKEATASLQSMPTTAAYAVPGIAFDRNYGTVVLGARTTLMGLEANLGASLAVGQKGGKDTTLFATFGGSF